MEKKVIVTVGEALDASLESFRRRFNAKESRSLRLRDGSLATRIKGNFYKGPFHIPRMYMKCIEIIDTFGLAK